MHVLTVRSDCQYKLMERSETQFMGTCQLAWGRVRDQQKLFCKADQPKITATNAASVFITNELRIVDAGQEIIKGRS